MKNLFYRREVIKIVFTALILVLTAAVPGLLSAQEFESFFTDETKTEGAPALVRQFCFYRQVLRRY